MRVTPEEKAQLREKILSETIFSLKKMGSSAAPVDKIMKRLGLTSGALYSHFKSKEDLFVQVILKEFDRLIENQKKYYEKYAQNSVSKFIEYYLSEKHVDAIEHGCMFVSLGADMHRLKSPAKAKIEAKLLEFLQVLSWGLPLENPEEKLFRMKFIFSSMIGTMILARSMKDELQRRDLLESSKQQLLKYVCKE